MIINVNTIYRHTISAIRFEHIGEIFREPCAVILILWLRFETMSFKEKFSFTELCSYIMLILCAACIIPLVTKEVL